MKRPAGDRAARAGLSPKTAISLSFSLGFAARLCRTGTAKA
jgi:hypothetical protein